MIPSRLRRWWDGWLTRELETTRPGGYPHAVGTVDRRHPRTRLVYLLKRDPEAYVTAEFRRRERSFRKRFYRGDW